MDLASLDLASLGRLIAERRYARGLTLAGLAAAAGVGRSTLAALESGRLPELGFNKVARICAAAGIRLETRPPVLHYPPRNRLRDRVPIPLSRAVLEEMIRGGNPAAWQQLLRALKQDDRGLLASRIRQVVGTLQLSEPNVAAFVALLPPLTRRAIERAAARR